MSTDIPKVPGHLDSHAAADTPDAATLNPMDADVQENLGERAQDVQQRIEEGFHEMEQRYGDAREQLRDYNDKAVEFIRENPAISLAGAVGVGYVLGRLAARRWLR